MVTKQEQLQSKLEILFPEFSDRIYYQPPAGNSLDYPCIVYHTLDIDKRFADNRTYGMQINFRVITMTRDKEDSYALKILEEITNSSFNNAYTSDGIYHMALSLYI